MLNAEQQHMSDVKYGKMMSEYHQHRRTHDRQQQLPHHMQSGKRASPQNGFVSVSNNILGNHPPGDILFLKCNVCDATSGSLQSFRKHFNQTHGCEPKPDQVTIQSITATRVAMQEQGLLPPPPDHSRRRCCSNDNDKQASRMEKKMSQKHCVTHPSHMDHHHNNGSLHDMEHAKHVNKDGSNMMKCMQCGQDFPTRDWGVFRRHVRAHEFPNDSKFRCNVCKQAYKDSQELKDHILSFHRVQPCVCIICDVGFTHMGALSKHMRLSHQSQPPPTMDYKCLYCSKRFEHHQQLFAHMQDHERLNEAQNKKLDQEQAKSSTPPIRKASPDSTGLEERRTSSADENQSSSSDTNRLTNGQPESKSKSESPKPVTESKHNSKNSSDNNTTTPGQPAVSKISKSSDSLNNNDKNSEDTNSQTVESPSQIQKINKVDPECNSVQDSQTVNDENET
jgi:DNA-directed RNA polymerase subunit RPC12/RpoP